MRFRAVINTENPMLVKHTGYRVCMATGNGQCISDEAEKLTSSIYRKTSELDNWLLNVNGHIKLSTVCRDRQ